MLFTSRALTFASLALGASALVVLPPQSVSFLSANASSVKQGKLGKDRCKCVGIAGMKGSITTPLGKEMVKYPGAVGSSCKNWENGLDIKACAGKDAPQWCSQEWCYVDPCNCDLEILPKRTATGVTFQGAPAYWSYNTCGSVDTYSKGTKGACVNQMEEKECSKLSDQCAWDGKQCLGKELLQSCKAETKLDQAVIGQDDCRCVGFADKKGTTKMFIDEKHEIEYPADVGGRCEAWEKNAAPACQKEGKKPDWCTMKWCWVDPCKCKASVPPKATAINSHLKFQGMVAHFSYAACGSEDAWSSENAEKYCHTQKSASDCKHMEKCRWTDKEECLTKEVAEICHEKSGAYRFGSIAALLFSLGSMATA